MAKNTYLLVNLKITRILRMLFHIFESNLKYMLHAYLERMQDNYRKAN